MGIYWGKDPDVKRYWLEDDTGRLFRTSLEADEQYSVGERSWVTVDFYDVISNTCNDLRRISEEEARGIIAERESEAAARRRGSTAQKRPQWGTPQWKRFFGNG